MSTREAPPVSLEFLAEPAFVLARDGEVFNRNAAAQRLLRCPDPPFDLFDYVISPHDEFRAYLRQGSGSSAPIVGAVTLLTARGEARLHLNCARMSSAAANGTLVMRCLMPRDDQFSLLQRRIEDLNAQLRRRQREKAILEETLRENRILLQELQHRVKNNLQMMVSLIQMSGKGRTNPEVQEVVDLAKLRLQAMAATQEAIYRSRQFGVVSVHPLLTDLVEAVGESFAAGPSLHPDIADVRIDSDVAHSLALIVNELTTNAIRHGCRDRQGVIRVSFRPARGGWELVVHDDGPGISEADMSGSSGLKLVRALCRQIGGAFDIGNDNGAKCTVRLNGDLERSSHVAR